MPRLVIISNRAPAVGNGAQDSGGLVVALASALKERDGLWIGSAPKAVAKPEETLAFHKGNGFDIALFELSEAEYENYYLGYANSVLWPAFHNRIDIVNIKSEFAKGYVRVSRRLAKMVAQVLRPDDLIWVHDYHLFPIGMELRRLGVENAIGFFLHIPFPAVHSLMTIPEHCEILRWLSNYDLVGLQTRRDVVDLLGAMRYLANGEVLSDGKVALLGKVLVLASFPISIDVARMQRISQRSEATNDPPSPDYLIGVDRLDYSKGLPQRLRGFQTFLERYPEHKRVSLLQIASPTRGQVKAYQDIQKELEQLEGQINGVYGDVDWTPVRYVHRNVSQDALAGLFRKAKAALVTPLFDGMNLVAKEFVAAQDAADPGVLILSQFAGAAEELTEALIVNPYDAVEMAAAIDRALRMSRAERTERHQALFAKIERNDIAAWRKNYLRRLTEISADKPPSKKRTTVRLKRALSELSACGPSEPFAGAPDRSVD